jgi:hypothetical protein
MYVTIARVRCLRSVGHCFDDSLLSCASVVDDVMRCRSRLKDHFMMLRSIVGVVWWLSFPGGVLASILMWLL